jgi:hypothetical protein
MANNKFGDYQVHELLAGDHAGVSAAGFHYKSSLNYNKTVKALWMANVALVGLTVSMQR